MDDAQTVKTTQRLPQRIPSMLLSGTEESCSKQHTKPGRTEISSPARATDTKGRRRPVRAALPQRFDTKLFLSTIGKGRTIKDYRKNRRIFAQGDPADALFYIQDGKIKLTVVSQQGKEAVVALLGPGDFFGEGCLAGQVRRMATATALSVCSLMRLEKEAVIRALHNHPTFSELFLRYVLSRNIRIEEDLVDQLFNSTEKRLARVLLLLAFHNTRSSPVA
jgi:CRP/FNR family cyclic AMP-dependent transcriptional regulator